MHVESESCFLLDCCWHTGVLLKGTAVPGQLVAIYPGLMVSLWWSPV